MAHSMIECKTRDISDYNEWCDTHKQDASLCHLIRTECPRCGKQTYVEAIGVCSNCEQIDKYKE